VLERNVKAAHPAAPRDRIHDAASLDARRFSDAQCAALFAAVLVDDEVDAQTELPDRITLDHDPAELLDCYRICRQLWLTGIDRDAMIARNGLLLRDRDLGAEDRVDFKYARARFKHLRFACALYGERHAYPILFDWMTTLLGHLQDAFRAGLTGKVGREARLCRLFLARGPWRLLRREVDRVTLTTSQGFRDYIAREIAMLDAVLSRDLLTGAEFHATRKVASRLVSFYDTWRTIAPSDEAFKMSRSLAAINGLMGAMHDDLVERRIAGTQDYHRDPFALPAGIRVRLVALVARYRKSGLT
jgi:hypothetical protein